MMIVRLITPNGNSVAASTIVLALALLVLPLTSAGCGQGETMTDRETTQSVVVSAQEVLFGELNEFADQFEAKIERAAMDIERKATSRQQRRTAAIWRVRSVTQCRRSVEDADAREALLNVWALCRRMFDYVETGVGRAKFGRGRQVALDASRELLASIETLARKYVPEDSFAETSERIATYAREHPIKGEFSEPPAKDFSDGDEGKDVIGQIVGAPLSPFAALRGVGETAGSMRELAHTADRFTAIFEEFPANARWQMQLLAMNLEELESVSETVASMRRLSESSKQLALLLDEMPLRLRANAEELLAAVDESQPGWRETLGEARRTAESISTAGRDVQEMTIAADRTFDNVKEASAALEGAAIAVTRTAEEVLKFIPASMKDETGQIVLDAESDGAGDSPDDAARAARGDDPMNPGQDTSFSFQAVAASAEALGETVEKLRSLVADTHQFAGSEDIIRQVESANAQLAQTINSTGDRIEGIIDHATKRLVLLLVLLFALILGNRIISKRW